MAAKRALIKTTGVEGPALQTQERNLEETRGNSKAGKEKFLIFISEDCLIEGAILVPEKKISTFFGLQSKRLLSRS